MCRRVFFPGDEESSFASLHLISQYGFNLIFFEVFNDIRERFWKVLSIDRVFMIGHEFSGMEDRVNFSSV